MCVGEKCRIAMVYGERLIKCESFGRVSSANTHKWHTVTHKVEHFENVIACMQAFRCKT